MKADLVPAQVFDLSRNGAALPGAVCSQTAPCLSLAKGKRQNLKVLSWERRRLPQEQS
ncbi:MAG: hypothetical protein ACI4SB_03045 [Acutalibacteraceae bacterium]